MPGDAEGGDGVDVEVMIYKRRGGGQAMLVDEIRGIWRIRIEDA